MNNIAVVVEDAELLHAPWLFIQRSAVWVNNVQRLIFSIKLFNLGRVYIAAGIFSDSRIRTRPMVNKNVVPAEDQVTFPTGVKSKAKLFGVKFYGFSFVQGSKDGYGRLQHSLRY